VSAMRWSTTSPALAPAPDVRLRSHAYSGSRPKRRNVVRARDMRPARAAMGGTFAVAETRTVGGVLETMPSGLTRARRVRAWVARAGDCDCRYARR
jgi:hypothetical protein